MVARSSTPAASKAKAKAAAKTKPAITKRASGGSAGKAEAKKEVEASRKAEANEEASAASRKAHAVAVGVRPKAAGVQNVASPGPARGNKMDIDRFFAFCQCSLKMEAQHFMDHEVKLLDPVAMDMWPHVKRMCERNLGKNEKWVPMHTVLGVHEWYLVTQIHHADVKIWDDFRRFVTMFIFRAHCKRELFEVQLPFLKKESFWKRPATAFGRGTPMEKAIQEFRAGGNALQTSCFLIIPERLVRDDDENIIINLLLRTQRLIGLAEDLWPIVNDASTSPGEKFVAIREKIGGVRNLGETWVKMLTVVMDIARPDMRLLHDRCEVGIGASDPLRNILEEEGLLPPKETAEKKNQRLDKFVLVPSIKFGVIAVKKRGNQLLQVTKGLAGTLDRAHAIAELLCKAANDGKQIDALNVMKKNLFADKKLKVKKLGLDKQMEELIAQDAQGVPQAARIAGPTPMEALVKLRDRICSTKTPSSQRFRRVLKEVEERGRRHFKHLPLVAEQMKTAEHGMSCATLQVQLCEFRQFENSLKQVASKRPASAFAEVIEQARRA